MLLWFVQSIFDVFQSKFNTGTATITTGNTTVAVNHLLGTSNFVAQVTPLGNPGGAPWVSGKTTSQFTINIPGALGGNLNLDWMVKAA